MSLIQVTKPTYAWTFDGTPNDYIGSLGPTSANINGITTTNYSGLYYDTTTPKYGSSSILFTNASPPNTGNCLFYTNILTIPYGGSNSSTFAFWFNAGNTGGSIFGLIGNGGANNTLLYAAVASGPNRISITSYMYGAFYAITANINLSQWYHLALTFTNTTQILYINGLKVGSVNYSAINGNTSNAWLGFTLGTWNYGVNSGVTCEIDDLRIYTSSLGDIQIRALYNNGGSPGVPASLTSSTNGKLVFYLPFDGSSNVDSVGGLRPVDPGQIYVIMSDFSTVPLTGTLAGNIVQTGQPQISSGTDWSLKFPGTVGSYITFADTRFSASSWWLTSGFTLEAWVNYTTFTNNGGSFPVSFGTMNPTNSTGPNWSFGANTAGRLAFYYFTTVGQTVTATSATLSLNTFYHICVQCDATNIYLYVNGAQVANQALVLTPQLTAGINFTIGQYNSVAGPNFYVGDVRLVYGAAVYAVAGFTAPTAPLPNYTTGGATTALRLRNINASNIPNPTFNTVNPKVGTASMVFNNVLPSVFGNTFVQYNHAIDICISGYTIALWANVYTLPAGVAQNIMNTRGVSQYQGQVRMTTFGTIPSMNYWNGRAGGGAYSANADFGAIAPNTWHHFAITIKPNGDISFYLDATEGTPGQNCQPLAVSMPYGGYMYALFLAGSAANPAYQNGMNGEIDDVRVYNYALSPAQITGIYNSTFPSLISPVTLTGTPILSQLSVAPVAAFSLRAVGGATARAVQVVPVAAFPPGAMNNPTVTSSTAYSQTLVGYPFGGSGNYTANCSSSGGVGSVYFAFDGISTTAWCTGGYSYTAVGITPGSSNAYPTGGQYSTTVSATPYYGEWLQLELPTSVILQSYSLSITTVIFGNFGYPYTWIFLGSNDRVNWNMIDNRNTTTYSSWVNQTPSVFTPTPVLTAYQYYRIVITNVTAASGSTGQLPEIASMTINGYNGSSWNADFYADRLGNLLTAPVTGTDLATWLGGSTGSVATWYDQSGNGNHATQGTQANRPVIQKGTKGPGYSVLFNGTTNNLILGSGSFLSNTPYSVSTVERRNTASFPMFFFGRVGGASITGSLHIGYVTNTALRFGLWATSSTTDEAISAYAGSAEPVGYNIQTFSTTSFMRNYRNAVLGSNNASTTPITNTDGTYSIGMVSTNYYSGEMYEILVFTKSLYDLDGTSSITQIYNNQLSYTGT